MIRRHSTPLRPGKARLPGELIGIVALVVQIGLFALVIGLHILSPN